MASRGAGLAVESVATTQSAPGGGTRKGGGKQSAPSSPRETPTLAQPPGKKPSNTIKPTETAIKQSKTNNK